MRTLLPDLDDPGTVMRILYSHRIQSRDGQAVHVDELIRALREGGHEVRVVGPGFYDRTDFGGESRIVALVRRVLPGYLQEVAEMAYNIPAALRLIRAYDEFRPDFVYERCNLYFLAGAWLVWRRNSRLLLEVNSPLADERRAHGSLRFHRLARWLEHLTWRSAAAVLPVTEVLADEIASSGVPRERIHVICNGVDVERFPERPEKPAGARVELGFVGFVREWHGMDAVIDGMATLDHGRIALTIIGDGPVRSALEEQANSRGLADVLRITGVVPPEEVAGMVMNFDIALQPKATPYASPLKIFDYMASACAIVAPDQANIREVLRHEETALLFDASVPGAMWAAVTRLVDDPILRRRIGRAARDALIADQRTWPANAARVLAIAEGCRSAGSCVSQDATGTHRSDAAAVGLAR